MKAFLTLLRSSMLMLVRNRGLLISSLGLALISIFVFGWLFGSNGTPKLALGVINDDTSLASQQLVTQLKASQSLAVTTGAQDAELSALRGGQRDAVIVLGPS